MKQTTIYNHEADSLQEAIGINYNDELMEKFKERLSRKRNSGKASVIAETMIEVADTPEELMAMSFCVITIMEQYNTARRAVFN